MKISKLILTSVLALAVLSLSAGPGLAQPNRNTDSNRHYDKSSPQTPQDRARKSYSRPDDRGPAKAPGGKQRYSRSRAQDWGRNQDHRSGYVNNKLKPGPKVEQRRPGSHQGFNYQEARKLAKSRKMAGYKPLPPNARRHMAVGRPLPGHLQARPLPAYMVKRLPRHPGYEWRIAGTDLLLVAAGTFIVYQIIENVFY